jgi:hypothetical protein
MSASLAGKPPTGLVAFELMAMPSRQRYPKKRCYDSWNSVPTRPRAQIFVQALRRDFAPSRKG